MAETNTAAVRRNRFRGRGKKSWLTFLVIVALLAGGGYFAYKYDQTQDDLKNLSANPQEVARLQTNQLVAEVGKIVQLPTGETPTVATVSDATKLKKQAFFAKAENGDKVLIFTQAKRAILYRPSTGKVIEIAPVNLGPNQAKTGQ